MAEPPLKGILKNAIHGTSSTPKRDPREIAIQHARILQHRKDLEAEILDSVEVLSNLPNERGSPYTASNPAPADVADFKRHVRLFQPGDYEDLIEERNANNLCAYTLCPRPKPKATPGGQWKLKNVGKPNFAIVDRKESERWCSEICKKRALYVKVQLSETAAWERIGVPDIEIDLYDEGRSPDDNQTDNTAQVQQDMARLKLSDEKAKAAQDSVALAIERGDVGDMAQGPKVELAIREKNVGPPVDNDDNVDDAVAVDRGDFAVEGYTPGTNKTKSSTTEDTTDT